MARQQGQDNVPLIGDSEPIQRMLEQVRSVARLNKPVLIIGERGTGKELVAARLHFLSGRWEQRLVKLNCAALTESLLETELFGYEAGAFTGAVKRRIGRFELADQGTLFLDEIATCSQRLQEKILRVVEYGEYERVGASDTLRCDVRILAATNVDLPRQASEGRFREDLLDRLSFDVITVPPLRNRGADIIVLSENFAVAAVREFGGEFFPGFSKRVIEQLADYPWPGNVRELKNVIERAVYRHLGSAKPIDEIVFDPFASPYRPEGERKSHLLERKQEAEEVLSGPYDFTEKVGEYERRLLREALVANRFNQRKAADFLSLTYNQLRGMLRKYRISTEESLPG